MTLRNEDLYAQLISAGFIKHAKGVLKKQIFEGYEFEVRPVNGSWKKDDEFYLYIYAKAFGDVMGYAFSNDKPFFDSYLPRKLVKDSSGCLAMVMTFWSENPDTNIDDLRSGLIYLRPEGLVETIENVTGPKILIHSFYQGLLGQYLVLIESVWVYLFLCNECGYSQEMILSNLAEPYMAQHIKFWRLSKAIDIQLIERFSSVYRLIKGAS